MSDPRRALTIAAIAGTLLVSGCKVDQQHEVSLYRDVLDQGSPPPPPPPAAGAPLSLAHALLLANTLNEQVAISGESYVQALIGKVVAAAGFLPSVDLSGSTSTQHSGGRTSHSTSASLRGSISILDLTNFSDVNRAAAAAEQSRFGLLDLRATVLIAVAQTYYQVLKSERSVRVLENSLALQTERVRDMQARETLGMSRPLDLAQTQADESRTKVSLLQARGDVRNGRATLAFLVGLPTVDGPLADEFAVPDQVAPTDELERQAREHRQDFLAAHMGVEVASQSVTSAVRRWYPSISLSASDLFYSHPSAGAVWGLSLSALVPIFSAGLIHADVRSAWSRYRQSRLSESLLERQIHEDITIADENLATSRAKFAELQIEVNAAQRAFDLSDAQYKLGSATNLDRLTAQDSLLNSQLQLSTEEYNFKIFYLDLLRKQGLFDQLTPATLPPLPGQAPAG